MIKYSHFINSLTLIVYLILKYDLITLNIILKYKFRNQI